jgi:hypothetical protein
MKKAKKLLVTLLVLTFVLSSFSVGFAADAEAKLPTEVVRAQALGILKGDDQGNLNLDKPITRAEALALIVRISGLEKSAELMKGQTRFSDVNAAPVLQWATGYINLGVGQGIVNGYPDGTFQGNKEVTYAEMAKMLLYAMNYGVTVEGAQWPAGVMGKADDLKVFDKVNALPNIPALRGDVVKMIDNSLTVKHLKQTGYGDFKQYEEGEDTFLSKMDVKELKKVVVTDIAKANSKLDDDEIKLDDEVYTLKADVSAEAIFGLKVDAWVNDDDEVFFVKVKTAEKDIIFDSVNKDASKDIVELKVEDDEFDWAKDAAVYVNFAKAKPAEVKAGYYGKFVLDKGEIVFANLFNFKDVNAGVVKELKGDKLSYYIGDREKSIRFADYKDGIYVYDAEFAAIDKDDIEADDVIYAWVDGKEIFIIVAGEKVEGKISRLNDKQITIDGKKYDVAGNATVSDNEDEDIAKYLDSSVLASEATNLAGEAAIAILDINGEIRHVRGDSKATSGKLYGLVMDAYRSGAKYTLRIFNKDGEKVAVEIDKKSEWDKFNAHDFSANGYIPVKYEVDKDNVIKENKIKIARDNLGAFGIPTVDNLTDTAGNTITFDKDDDYIKVGANDFFFIGSSTVLMKYKDDDDEGLVKWDDIKDKKAGNAKAYIVGEPGKTADFVAFYDDFDDIVKDKFYGIVTVKAGYDGDDWVATVDAYGKGEVEYKVDKNDRDKVEKGKVVEFKLTSSNEMKDINEATVTKTVYKKSGNSLKFVGESTFYRMTSDTVAYFSKEDSLNIDKKVDIDDIDEGDKVICWIDNSIIKAIKVDKRSTPGGGSVAGKKIEAVDIGNAVFVYDGEGYKVIATTVLYDKDGNHVATGSAVLNHASITAKAVEIELSSNVVDGNPVVKKITYLE